MSVISIDQRPGYVKFPFYWENSVETPDSAADECVCE